MIQMLHTLIDMCELALIIMLNTDFKSLNARIERLEREKKNKNE